MVIRTGLVVLLLILPAFAQAFTIRVTSETAGDSLRDDMRAASLTAALKTSEDPYTPQDILAAARADYARLVTLLYDRGYFAPIVSIRVDGREVSNIPALSQPSQISQVEIAFAKGRKFTFGRTMLAPLASGTVLPEAFATGRTASLTAMQQAVETGVSEWRNQGHAKADVAEQSVTARHNEGQLDAVIRLKPGPRLRFGALNVQGQRRMKPERIREIAGLPEGAVYNPDELRRAATRLRRAGVFSSVAFTEADTPNADNSLDITAQVAEARRRRFGFGAELSSREGVRLSTFWMHRNLFGGAERLRFDAEIRGIGGDTGGEDHQVSVNFTRPATFSSLTDFFVELDLVSLDEPNFRSERLTLEAGINHYPTDNRTYSYAIGYDAAETRDAFGARDYKVLTLPLSAEWDYRNDSLDATSGYYAKAAVTPFVAVSGTEDGARVLLDARTYHSFGDDGRVTFALRGQLGAIFGPEVSRTPTDYLFYSGGGGTVRGQEYQSLGLTLPSGRTVGGRSFLGVSSEVRVKTGDRLSVVGFLDMGYIGEEEFPDASSGDWHSGAGAGIRYDTGLGPIRVDLGVPLRGPDDENGFEIYIGIGQAF